jgi:hypothetical protein
MSVVNELRARSTGPILTHKGINRRNFHRLSMGFAPAPAGSRRRTHMFSVASWGLSRHVATVRDMRDA